MKIEKKSASSSKKLFFSGVFVLTLANVLVKIVGLVSKIVLNRVVGSVGAGYYSSAYEIYAYLYVISTSGLPVALSILVSRSRARGRFKETKSIFDVAILLFLIIGVISSLLMIVFSKEIAVIIGAEKTSFAIITIAPTMLFICISSCLRGYFQGYQLMGPTAISQLIEALSKVGIGASLALWAKGQGYEDYMVASFTILGVTVGVLLGMIFLYIRKAFFKEQNYNYEYLTLENTERRSVKQILKDLLVIAIPITLSSSVLSLTTIIDTFMVQNRLLAAGLNEITVRVYYGDYTSLVISMFNLPTILFYPIANALVPLISATNEQKNLEKCKKIREVSLKLIMIIALPCAFGLGAFAKPILSLLMFKEDSVQRAAPWLSVAAASVVFLGIISITNTFLNASGKQKLPIISMLVGAVAKLVSNYFLLDKVGILGAPISTVICYLFAAGLNIFFTVKYVGSLPSIGKTFGLPLLSSVLSIGVSAVIYGFLIRFLPMLPCTIAGILLSIILYVFVSFKIRSIEESDLLLLPKGEKLVKLFKKLGLIKKQVQNV